MAAIFQLRRGTTGAKPTLAAGELYVNTTSQSLQVGIDGLGTEVTLVKLNDENIGSIRLTGDIKLSGSIYLGDGQGTDNISALGVFTTNLVPSPGNTLDIGTSTAAWRTIYATTLSSSYINAPQMTQIGIVTGSLIATASLFKNTLVSTSSFSSSITGVVNQLAYFNGANTLGSLGNVISANSGQTIGFGTSNYTSYAPERIIVDGGNSYNIATFQTTQQSSYAEVNIKNLGSGSNSSTDLVIWNDQSSETAVFVDLGMNSSNYSAGYVGYGSDGYLFNSGNDLYIGSTTTGSHGHLHLFGGNLWQSSSISIYNDSTIGINTDKFNNNASTIPTAGFAVEISGSVKFDNNINVIGTISASQISGLEAYTSSLKTAISASGANLTILGNLTVQGSQSVINSTTIQLGDNIIELNGTGVANAGLLVKDPTGGSTISGSLLWDSTNDYWKGGTSGNESKFLRAGGDSVISASSQIDLTQTTNYTSVFNSLATITGSLIATASSHESRLATIGTYTSSLETRMSAIGTETASIESRFTTLASYTASINQQTASVNQATASLQIVSASLNTYTASANTWSASVENRFTTLASYTGSINQHTASLNTWSASINSFTASMTASYLVLSASVAYINTVAFGGVDLNAQFTALQSVTSSLQSFTSSANIRLNNLETTSASVNISIANLNAFTASGGTAQLNAFTASVLSQLITLGTETASIETRFTTLQSLTSSYSSSIANINAATSSYETKGRGIISGSSQLAAYYEPVASSTHTLFSGSSQIGNYVATITGTANQIIVAGSGVTNAAITLSTPQSIGTTSDVQFNNITASAGIRATGDIVAYYSSDERLKENITPIENALSKVELISGNTYDWKEGFDNIHPHKGNDVGVIAQEIEKVLPQVVIERENGYKAVDYEKIIPLLIEAVKELSAKVKELENK
jgi:uncharacterized protein YoxC